MNVSMQIVFLLHPFDCMAMKRRLRVARSPISHMFINLQKSNMQDTGYVIQKEKCAYSVSCATFSVYTFKLMK